MTYLVRLLDDDGNFELIDKAFLHLYPDLERDDDGNIVGLVELSDEQYQAFCQRDNGKTKFVGGEFVFAETEMDEQAVVEQYRSELIKHIDDTAAEIAAHWTRFAEEYKAREEAALAYQAANFEGEPSIYITSFSSVAGLDDKSATLLILQQAAGLRHLQEQLAVQRMRKYELKKPNLTIEQMQELHDDIINQMYHLAEAQQ